VDTKTLRDQRLVSDVLASQLKQTFLGKNLMLKNADTSLHIPPARVHSVFYYSCLVSDQPTLLLQANKTRRTSNLVLGKQIQGHIVYVHGQKGTHTSKKLSIPFVFKVH
jgi:hypothetical protein